MDDQHAVMDDRTACGLLAAVQDVPDPRREHGRRHALCDVLMIAFAAIVSGANDFEAIAEYALAKEAFLRRFLELRNGIPSHDTFRRLFLILEPRLMEDCLVRWLRLKKGLEGMDGQVVAIDGKTLRGTFDHATGSAGLHLVSAWLTEHGMTLGQEAVDEKSNEITAIPALIERLDLKGATVTIDAMGCQRDIAEKIRQADANYVLAVKGNQEGTFKAVLDAFETHLEADQPPPGTTCTDRDQTHGRRVKRAYHVLPAPQAVKDKQWRDVRSIVMVHTECEQGDTVTHESRYYLSSLGPRTKKLARTIRAHWQIENSLHWTLDVTFREDDRKLRHRNAIQNHALMNRIAVSLLKNDKTRKASIRRKRHRAGWNDDYLLTLLTQT